MEIFTLWISANNNARAVELAEVFGEVDYYDRTFLQSFNSHEYLEACIRYIEELSPTGFYFGPKNDDPTHFGFWPDEEDEDDEDDQGPSEPVDPAPSPVRIKAPICV